MTPRRVVLIQNCRLEGFGLYARHLSDRGAATITCHPYRGDPLPSLEDVAAVLVGGTPISVRDADDHEFLTLELHLLERALARDIPCFGICGGGQMLAHLLGAPVRRNRVMEIGSYRVRLTDAGRADPLLAGFPRSFPVFHWHGDTFDVPAGGVLLVEGDDCVHQMFRCGPAVGVQFHLEVSADEAGRWAAAYTDELERVGKDRAHVVEECHRDEPQMGPLARRLLESFLGW